LEYFNGVVPSEGVIGKDAKEEEGIVNRSRVQQTKSAIEKGRILLKREAGSID